MATINYTRVARNVAVMERSPEAACPPMWVLDKIADEKFTGKFNMSKNNLCGTCFTYKSVNGTCGC